MYTRCPECETMFHLTVEDLRQAGGRVRCGECTHVFYGMDFLAEEPDDDTGHYAITAEANDAASQSATTTDQGFSASAVKVENFSDDNIEEEPDSSEILFTSDDPPVTTTKSANTDVPKETDDAQPADDAELDRFLAAFDDDDTDFEFSDSANLIISTDEPISIESTNSFTIIGDVEIESEESSSSDDLAAEGDTGTRSEPQFASGASEPELTESNSGFEDSNVDEAGDELVEEQDDSIDSDIDDTIWERIPGVGAALDDDHNSTTNLQENPAFDTGEFLARDDEIGERQALESSDENDYSGNEVVTEDAPTNAFPDTHVVANTGDAKPTVEEDFPETRSASDAIASNNETESESKIQPETATVTDSNVTKHAEESEPTLEFNVPEDEWSTVFKTDAEIKVTTESIVVPDSLGENDSETDTGASSEPPWQFSKYNDVKIPGQRATISWLAGSFLLLAILIGQLVHYNRDNLATHPEYGERIRELYAQIGVPLFPEWSTQDYEIRGSEAVVGETGPDVMDIRTQIAAIGDASVGLPQLRVVIRDRWSNPVAARNFRPDEYASKAELPENLMLNPNTSITAHLSILDPGSGAQGYELEICVPQRNGSADCSGKAFK